jgi:DNA-binding winged helix-turn-helix (wHTH) protein/tetratricopeptide (TPR) repeat protein
MAANDQYTIGPFRFDARTGGLWRGDVEAAKLTPRAAAVLAMLAVRSQDVVTKQELFDTVWRGLVVTDDALTTCIQELRAALGDDARRPSYIETRHRRGYRLMVPAVPVAEAPAPPTPPLAAAAHPSKLVGRSAEMEELHRRYGLALAGVRQLVFVTGEPGIGKSALAGAFTEALAGHHVRVAQGQCLDHHGVGEPYLPLIEALTRLAAAPDGASIKSALATHAPSWLAQMPSLWTRSERSALERRGRATRERMLRELTQAIEAVAGDSPLVLKLEDIQWSDASTLDWLVHFACRPEPARLMVLATYRPADAGALAAGLASITSELALHGRCHEIALSPLTLEAIELYLSTRLGPGGRIAQPREIVRMLLERTGGNPLFMVSIVNQLAQHDGAAATPGALVAIPQDVRRFIERQIDELSERDRALLTAASVIRREFATAAVAAALDTDIEQVETTCARLARQGVFVYRSGSTQWPDGTPTELCTFRHDLYRELLYERLSATRRAQSHARVGARLEAAWATRPDTIAAEIAEHFERGNAPARAIPHHQRAAAKALRRSANQEAIGHLRRALDAIGHIADETERNKVEVELQVAMGAAYMAIHGFGAPEVQQAYARAETLCDRLGERADIFPALWGQWLFRWGRSEMDAAWRLGNRLLALAARSGSAALELQAHHAMWATTFGRGEFAQTRWHAEAGLAIYDASVHQTMASSYGNHDAALCACYFSAFALAIEGDGQRARASIESMLATARGLDDPFSLALVLFFSSAALQILGDVKLAAAHAEECVQMATEHAFALAKSWSSGVMGWSLVQNGEHARGLAMLEEALASLQATQSRHFLCYLLGLLADARFKAGLHAEALEAVEQGLALSRSGERFYRAELYRLHGVLCAHPSLARHGEAAVSFRKAIAIARQQGARIFERKARGNLDTLEAG